MFKKMFNFLLVIIIALNLCSFNFSNEKAKVEKVVFKEKTENTNINMVTPKIKVKNIESEIKMNSLIEEDSKETLKSFKEDCMGNVKEIPNLVCELVKNFKTEYNKKDILSISTETYVFTGGAHGNTFIIPYNFNIKTGEIIPLSSLFKSGYDYKDVILNVINTEISANRDKYLVDSVNSFNETNYYITKDGIVVFYDLYEIAPYVSSIPKFLIPYKVFGNNILI